MGYYKETAASRIANRQIASFADRVIDIVHCCRKGIVEDCHCLIE